ncbi:MAG TPA: aminopeptidase P family protein [Acholeplasmataceae bacterium]|nr:aminopeptidase P family protein [Acholeplasmataceae bacterium]
MIRKRRDNLIEFLQENSIALFYSGLGKQRTGDQNYPFSVNRNFFYLTNIDQENVVLLVAKGSNNNSNSYLFIEKRSELRMLWDGPTLTFRQAADLSEIPLENIKEVESLDQFVNQLLSVSRAALFGKINNLYLDLTRENINAFDTLEQLEAKRFKNVFPGVNILGSQHFLAHLRMRKDELEVNETKEAIKITNTALNHVMKTLRPNMKEYEIEAEYNYILNKHNTVPSFATIAASGSNACVLHYVANNDNINDNELILFDLGVQYNNYCSDISRTYPANGKFTERQKEVYEIVLNVNKKTIEWLKPGKTIKEFNEYGKMLLTEGAKKLGLIKDDHEISKYYYHSLGHYLGLDVHDVGLYDQKIPVGAIITVEPGLYIAEEAIGIRIEDDILITEDGNINLSKEIIKEVVDIESFMK